MSPPNPVHSNDTEETYRIRALGQIGERWAGSFGAMVVEQESVATSESDAPATITVLTGTLSDQAALMGVINLLYDLGLCLLSVESFGGEGKQVLT